MKCQKCGKETTAIEVNVFDCFGSDRFVKTQINEIAEYVDMRRFKVKEIEQ